MGYAKKPSSRETKSERADKEEGRNAMTGRVQKKR